MINTLKHTDSLTQKCLLNILNQVVAMLTASLPSLHPGHARHRRSVASSAAGPGNRSPRGCRRRSSGDQGTGWYDGLESQGTPGVEECLVATNQCLTATNWYLKMANYQVYYHHNGWYCSIIMVDCWWSIMMDNGSIIKHLATNNQQSLKIK